MGYGYYKLPSGKEAGYHVEATCEHPGCTAKIHRGLAYACGGDVGDQGGASCEGYFCDKHRWQVEVLPDSAAALELPRFTGLCAQCLSRVAFLDWIEEAEEYRKDPQFAPNTATAEVLKNDGCAYRFASGSDGADD